MQVAMSAKKILMNYKIRIAMYATKIVQLMIK